MMVIGLAGPKAGEEYSLSRRVPTKRTTNTFQRHGGGGSGGYVPTLFFVIVEHTRARLFG